MKRPNLLLVFYLILVFASGIVVGFFGFRFYALESVSAKMPARNAADYRHKYLEELRSRLGLRENQVLQLDAILDATRLKYREFRERHRPELNSIQEEQVARIRAILTEPQRMEYEKMRADQEQRRRQSQSSQQRW